MKVLIAFERSGIVRDAFREAGHDAMSCDLEPTDRPGPHHQGDARPLMRLPWDLIIAHPPCPYLTSARGTPVDDDDLIVEALECFIDCLNANAPRVAVENPLLYKWVRAIVGQPDCRVHPYHFGDEYLKRTYFWLNGLPPLMATHYSGEDKTLPRIISSGGSKRGYVPGYWGAQNPKRSEFHPGMAAVMAQQWGSL